MPRIRKSLPPDRADYSFGDLIYWHLFVYGTRPGGDPAAAAGREWKIGEFCEKLPITDRTLRNWIAGKSYPDSTVAIVQALFGDNRRFDPWRLELAEAVRHGQQQRGFQTFPETDTTGTAAPPRSDATDPDALDRAEPFNAGDRADTSGSGSAHLNSGHGRRAGSTALVPYARSGDHDARPETGATVIHPAWRSRPSGGDHAPPRRTTATVLVSGLVALAGLYAWTRPAPDTFSRAPSPPTSTNPAPSAPKPVTTHETAEEKPAAPTPPKQDTKPVETTPSKPEASKAEAAPPPEAPKAEILKPAPPNAAPPPATVDPKQAAAAARAAENERIIRETIAARQAAHEAEVRAAEETAREHDRDADDAATARRDQETAARQVAGMGYRLMENTSVASGAGLAPILTDGATACAAACLRENCDAFTYSGAPHSGTANYCYRYRGAVSFRAEPSFRAGQRMAEAAPKQVAAAEPGAGVVPIITAQATPAPSIAGTPDNLVRCANGPVKVTGFRITCDAILGGGTTLGSAQLRYTVATINQCAAKCRPIAACVGFTYNAADPDGQHACEIFGPTPEMRTVNGYVSGVR